MPCGPDLIEAVAACLQPDDGLFPSEILAMLNKVDVTPRAVRYAIAELIKSGRARRNGQQGPVYAVRME